MVKSSAQSDASSARRARTSLSTAFAGSALCHLVIIIVCAFIGVMADSLPSTMVIHGTWNTPEPVKIEDAPPLLKPVLRDNSHVNTRPVPATFISTQRSSSIDLPMKQTVDAPVSRTVVDSVLRASFADVVGPLRANGDGTSSAGGDGGAAKDAGFFGFQPEGRSIVFVVDASASMNRTHDSEWKTRFRRLKAELVNAVGSMTPEQQFFIIFFNHETNLMPARAMQAATPNVKQHYLKWVATQRAIGETDPRQALRIAMALQPETIYFLTDGSFDGSVRRDLMKLRQSRSTIHTFAFSERAGEGVMKNIARSNNGKYHYVP